MGRRLQRVGGGVVVGMAEIVRHVEDEIGEDEQEDHGPERVLHGGWGVKSTTSVFDFTSMPVRIVLADDVKRPDMQDNDASKHERQQVMQRKEAVEGRIVDREAAEQQLLDPVADQRDGGEEAGDDGGAPERHLPPGQHVAHERRRHHQQKVGAAEHPQKLARRLVGAVIEAAGACGCRPR